MFRGSADYWESRYAKGGLSGAGSYGALATFKASVVNEVVREFAVASVIEFGCGDGNQLSLAIYPRYLGLDVSATAVKSCISRFMKDDTKSFLLYKQDCFADVAGFLRSDLALSIDVLYHLVEDSVYETYLAHLFGSADRYVIVYSSNLVSDGSEAHVKHRVVTSDIERMFGNTWKLHRTVPNAFPASLGEEVGSSAQFFLYVRAA